MTRTATLYDDAFYAEQADGSLASARAVLPLVFGLVHPANVVDIGCGVGTWLAVARENGITDVLGVDGDYVDKRRLLIPAEQYLAADIVQPVRLGRRYDLAISVEVAEHLSARVADRFVTSLCNLADVVLFSAAIPKQIGTGHINLQWPSYWQKRFDAHGYVALDAIRPAIFSDTRIDWWYRQNLLLMVQKERYQCDSRLQALPVYNEDILLMSWPVLASFVEPGLRDTLQLLRRTPALTKSALRRRLSARRRAS